METALKTTGQPVRRGSMAHDHDAYAMLADMAALQRDAAALRQYAPRAEELAERDGHRLYRAIAHRALGVLRRLEGEHDVAEARLNQALDLFKQMNTHWQAGRTLAEQAELAQAQSNWAAARGYFAQALELFEAMKAVADAERTRAGLDALR